MSLNFTRNHLYLAIKDVYNNNVSDENSPYQLALEFLKSRTSMRLDKEQLKILDDYINVFIKHIKAKIKMKYFYKKTDFEKRDTLWLNQMILVESISFDLINNPKTTKTVAGMF